MKTYRSTLFYPRNAIIQQNLRNYILVLFIVLIQYKCKFFKAWNEYMNNFLWKARNTFDLVNCTDQLYWLSVWHDYERLEREWLANKFRLAFNNIGVFLVLLNQCIFKNQIPIEKIHLNLSTAFVAQR